MQGSDTPPGPNQASTGHNTSSHEDSSSPPNLCHVGGDPRSHHPDQRKSLTNNQEPMRTITIHEETATAEDMAEVLDRVAELLREGYTTGYEPSWELEGDDEEEEEEEEEDTADTLRDQGKTILDEIAEHYTRHVSQATQDDAAQRQRLNDAADQFCREDIARAELRDEITAEQAEELRDQIHDHAGNLQP